MLTISISISVLSDFYFLLVYTMGKKCIFLNCGHYKAPKKEPNTPQIKQRHRQARASAGCTIYSIPPSDSDETYVLQNY